MHLLHGNSIAEIVPDLVANSRVKIELSYGGNELEEGDKIKPSQIKDQPRVYLVEEGGEAMYTLMAVDPDAPSPEDPKWSEYLLFLVTNIAGGKVSTGTIVADYVTPEPLEGTHRYIWLLYKQPTLHPLTTKDPTHGRRQNFSAKNFASLHNLGAPVAATYLTASA